MEIYVNGIPVLKAIGYLLIAFAPALVTMYLSTSTIVDEQLNDGEGWSPDVSDFLWLVSIIWFAIVSAYAYASITGGG